MTAYARSIEEKFKNLNESLETKYVTKERFVAFTQEQAKYAHKVDAELEMINDQVGKNKGRMEIFEKDLNATKSF